MDSIEIKKVNDKAFADAVSHLCAAMDKDRENFVASLAQGLLDLAGACWEAGSKNEVHQHLTNFYKKFQTASTNHLEHQLEGTKLLCKTIGCFRNEVEEAAPGIFDVPEEPTPKREGIMCVVQDEDGTIRPLSVDEVAALLDDEELARMEKEIGEKLAKPFRDAKNRQKEE